MRVLLLTTIFATGCSPFVGHWTGSCGMEIEGVEGIELPSFDLAIHIQKDTRGALLGESELLPAGVKGNFSGAVIGDGFSGVATWAFPSLIITMNATPLESGEMIGTCTITTTESSPGLLTLTPE